GRLGHRTGLGRTRNGAGPLHAEASDLGPDHDPSVQPRPVGRLLEGAAVEAVASLEAGEARLLAPLHAAAERLIGPVESRQHVWPDMRVDGRVFGDLGADRLQLRCLLVAADADAASLPRGDALLQGGVVELAAAPQDFVQRPLLGGRRTTLLLECLAPCLLFQVALFCLIGVHSAMRAGQSAEATRLTTGAQAPWLATLLVTLTTTPSTPL